MDNSLYAGMLAYSTSGPRTPALVLLLISSPRSRALVRAVLGAADVTPCLGFHSSVSLHCENSGGKYGALFSLRKAL